MSEPPRLRCARCDYDLSGQDWSKGPTRCPECGSTNSQEPEVRAYRPWPRPAVLYARMVAPGVVFLAINTAVGALAPRFSPWSALWTTMVVFVWPFFYANVVAAVCEPPETARLKVAALSIRGAGLNLVIATIWLLVAGWLGL